MVNVYPGREPAYVVGGTALAKTCRAAIGGEAAITPVAVDLVHQTGVQRKAASRQHLKRRAVAPVEGEEAA